MNHDEAQIVLAAAGYYKGGIDGKLGMKSKAAFDAVARDHASKYALKITVWRGAISSAANKRKRVAAVQACLNALGYEAGVIDGYVGHNTREALNALLYALANGKQEVVDRTPLAAPPTPLEIPRQSEVRAFYGDPETQVPGRLTQIELPFRLRIDYNLRQTTRRITVHEKVAPSLEKALIAVHDHYGRMDMEKLGIDRYAGAYNKRKMRGGSSWSMHAYGCAIDFYARPNGLRMRCPEALFCGKVYKPFLDIMEGSRMASCRSTVGR